MLETTSQILMCVSDPEVRAKISAAAGASGTTVRDISPAALLRPGDPPFAHAAAADCILLQVQELSAEVGDIIDRCRLHSPGTPLLAALAEEDVALARSLIQRGVFQCLTADAATEEFRAALRLARTTAAQNRSAALQTAPWKRMLVGESASIQKVTRIIELVAKRRCTILIGGETGTGKEMAARAIHAASDRSRKPMVSINCGAIPENLIETELFGHVKGAFTGAVNHRIGRFEQAEGGTLFLDEIGDLPFDLQSKLLRVLQEREIQKLGSTETVKVDVRVIAATNADLLAQVQKGLFREDLYYRLNVVPIHMPSLAERPSDIQLLAEHFVRKVCQAEDLPLKSIHADAIQTLTRCQWPGNVRQLENLVEHAVVMSGEREVLHPSDFPVSERPGAADRNTSAVPAAEFVPEEGIDYAEVLRQFERSLLQQAMHKAQGNKTLAADLLRLPRTTLLHKLRVLDPLAA